MHEIDLTSNLATLTKTLLHCDGIWLHAQMYCKPAVPAAVPAADQPADQPADQHSAPSETACAVSVGETAAAPGAHSSSSSSSSSSAQWGPFEAPLPPWAVAFVDVHP